MATKFVNQVGDPASPSFFEFIIRGALTTTGGQVKPCINVFHFRRSTVGDSGLPINTTAVLSTVIEDALAAATVSRYAIKSYEGRPMDDPTAMAEIITSTVVGAISTDGYASDDAVYFQLKTGFRTRNFFGSKHFGGFAEADTVNDQLSGSPNTHWTDVKTALESYASGVTDADGNIWQLIVLSRELSDLEANPSIFTGAVVNEVILNKTIGTMKHRRQKTVR